jgi:opacity protein-like surface antigen
MTSIRRAVLTGAALIAGAFSATAADLGNGRGGSLKDYGYTPQMATSPAASWYVRFDVGHARFDDPIMVEDGRFDLTNTAIDETWTLGGGIGMYFSNKWRGDITVSHLFDTDARGTLQAGSSINGERRFGFDSTVVLANIYYDFDRGGRINPYLGLGLGVAHNRTKTGSVSDACGCTGTIESGDERHVAAAAMAGVSIALRDRLHFDAGYRFLYLGEVATGPIRATTTALPVTTYVSNDPTVENIHAHEFRVGLRYDIR